MSRKGSIANKRILLYALIGILAVSLVALTTLGRTGAGKTPEQLAEEDLQQRIASAKLQFCGPDSEANSTAYVREFVLPAECEMPLGMAINDDSVWYLSTKQGTLGSYDLSSGQFQEYEIPSWPPRSNPSPTVTSMIWDAKIDGTGNIWFTDFSQNLIWKFDKAAGEFASFKSPGTNPISFDFDSDGNIYMVGVRSKSLYFGDVAQMKPGTLDGFTEIKLPLDAFEGIPESTVSSGSVVVDRERNIVWTSVLAFEQRGQIFSYDADANQVSVYDLPEELSSPVGTAVDRNGSLWVTDHGTSIFFMLNPEDGSLTRYVTSPLSSKITGVTTTERMHTWPYWMETDSDGNIWFNQHIGNKISKFDPDTQTLVEYWVPTQNEIWGNCPENAQTCGFANALQLATGPDNQVWFTEWSENKIGTVRNDVQVSLSVTVPDEVTVNRGDSTEIKVDVSASSRTDARMVSSGTFTTAGVLGNSTGIFSQQSISVDAGGSRSISYVFTPADDLTPGQYMLMLGADQGDVAVLKAVRVNVA